jgi:hypothetical protein
MSEISLPIREPHTRERATTPRIWHTRNRGLMVRVLHGLRALDYPAACKSLQPLRGYAHAHQVMAAHARHRCPRYRMAGKYTMRARP